MAMEKIKGFEWNLNFAGCDNVKPANFVPKYVSGFDFGVFTEVRYNRAIRQMIDEMGDYDFICSDEQEEDYFNQIVIIARKRFGLSKVKGSLDRGITPQPDFLHGRITVGEKEVNLVGIRIKIKKDVPWSDRYQQFMNINLNEYTEGLRRVICLGDFNSGQIRGDGDADYSDVKALYQYRNKTKQLSDLRFYNFHLIKESLESKFVMREILSEDNSWGLSERGGVMFYGWPGSRLKNDLMFYTDDIKGHGTYSWDHVSDNEIEYLDMLIQNQYKFGNKINHGYPDHARLIAEFSV